VLEGRVRDVAHGGDAVVETERGIVFARGALPGERVEVQIEHKAGGVQRGKLLAVLEPSPDRIVPPCPIAERCGGCPLMALAPEAQARFKRQRLQRVLEQRGYTGEVEWIGSPGAVAYRTRARLAWERKGGGARIGYHAAASHALVDVERCLVLAQPLAAGLTRLRTELAPVLQGSGELVLGLGAGELCVAELKTDASQPPEVYGALERLVTAGALAGAALRAGGRDLPPARFGDPRQVALGADGQPLWAAAGGFTQANPDVNAQLVRRVAELAEPAGASVLELFAGHGNFSVALAQGAAELCAVESDRAASELCRTNLVARNFSNARVVCEDAARHAAARGSVDVVVLDPPRSGAREALPGIVARRPRRIVYVSCDATTLRRDLGDLITAGYAIDAAAACDMFPQTAHLESVVRLVRNTEGRAQPRA
jgi:23S rRNA (uracil1939-C5)-methyltransferase